MKRILIAALLAVASVGAQAESACEQFADDVYNVANYRDHGHTKTDAIMYVAKSNASEESKRATMRIIRLVYEVYGDGRGAAEIRNKIKFDCNNN